MSSKARSLTLKMTLVLKEDTIFMDKHMVGGTVFLIVFLFVHSYDPLYFLPLGLQNLQ